MPPRPRPLVLFAPRPGSGLPLPAPAWSPAGQASAPPAAPAAPAAVPPPVDVNPDGSLTGIEGVLHQIAGALTGAAVPALREQILPVLQQDTALQQTVGAAAGRAAAETLQPWVAVIAVSLAALAAVGVAKLADRRPPPPPPPPPRAGRRSGGARVVR